MSEALVRLAERHGIARAWHDLWGRQHEVPHETLSALLAAMGVAAGDEASVHASLAAHEAARWAERLPPVAVVREGDEAITLRVRMPPDAASRPLQWLIDTEDGARQHGTVFEHEMPELERADGPGQTLRAHALRIAGVPGAGYHRLRLVHGDQPWAETRLIVAPRQCHHPRALDGDGRVWGAAAQVYALRSERNWGIGDYSDLATLTELLGLHGAGIVGVNPLHALFAHNPAHASPYSPSSRCFLNTLLLDVEAIDDFRECEAARALVRAAAFQGRLQALRGLEQIDHAAVYSAKREVLERLYGHFRAVHEARCSARAARFDAWRRERGQALQRFALFEALQEHWHQADNAVWGWPVWPEAYRDPASPAVAAFAQAHDERVGFHAYLQWQAELQLAAVARRAAELGLGVGLYADLAVSVDRAGAEVWSHQDLYARDTSVGAPPDDFNLAGQDWGLPAYVPHRLRAAAYQPLVDTLRANMRHAGALRIDHVMGLMRLFWVPAGLRPAAGAYVHYAFDDMLAIVALESRRNRCLVIGEDLGTVPDEVRHRLAEAGVLSYRLLYFQRGPAQEFVAPAAYPRHAIAAVSTHDLPTLAGWWAGHDLATRTALALFPRPEMREAQVVERAQDRARLLLALEREGLLPPGATVDPVSMPEMSPAFCQAVHRYLARTPACVVVAQLEDVIGQLDQVNLPGTIDQHPNWRRKLALGLERWAADPRFVALARLFGDERGTDRAPVVRRESLTAVIPRATYRVQLHRDFRFRDAAALVPYLAQLGISHLYCSPFLRARPGSRHGYDIVDHQQFNPEIGSADEFERLSEVLKQHGMGMIVDVVPNHMGVQGADNAWWLDVLENGQASLHAEFFDIDWQVADPALAGRVLLPLLGDQYGVVLERGELQLVFEPQGGSFALRYHEHRLPIDPSHYPRVLSSAMRLVPPAALEPAAADAVASLLAALGHLPPRDRLDAAARAERHRDKAVHKASLARLVRELPVLAAAIEQAVGAINGEPQRRASFDALDALIDAQPYRLAHWRVAADEINYRRFFDVNDLAALRMEEPQVFDAAHRLILELAAAGRIDGLRIDHPDGLFDPAAYFRRLQERYARGAGAPGAAVSAGPGRPARPLYVVVEKIIASHEQLPRDWAVYGTTGYRFSKLLDGLFVDGTARLRLERSWRAFAGAEARDFDELAYSCRMLVMRSSLAGELTVLATALHRLARADRRTRDYTLTALRRGLAEVVANFPVYRTYIAEHATAEDGRFIDWAVARARRRAPVAQTEVFDFIHAVLLGRAPADADPGLALRYRGFAQRLQQFTAPVAAKGIEDTAFYRHHRLVALNEVGGAPDEFGVTVRAFHGASRDRARQWPHTMLATSTHDTKRSEDVRARLLVLSELPAAWRLSVRRWSRWMRAHRSRVDGEEAPSRNDEYLLYQTLVGSWPFGLDADGLAAYRERIDAFMRKAVREAKQHSSWIAPNGAYEAALTQFIGRLLERLDGQPALDELRAMAEQLAWYGALNGLSQAAIKFTSPGVPDLYQGQETIRLSLVDPDNRREVDHRAGLERLQALQRLAAMPDPTSGIDEMLRRASDGRAKLWVTWRALQLRRERPDLFTEGDYRPLKVSGARSGHVLAYARERGGQWLVLVAARLMASLGVPAGEPPIGPVWSDTQLPLPMLPAGCRLRDALSGAVFDVDPRRPLALAQVLARLPVAILHGPMPPASVA